MLYFPCQKAENFLKVALISKQELILPRDFWCCYFCSLHGHPPEVWSNYKLLKNCNLASKGVILRSKWETVTVTTNDQTIWMPSIWKVTVLAPCSIACSQKRTQTWLMPMNISPKTTKAKAEPLFNSCSQILQYIIMRGSETRDIFFMLIMNPTTFFCAPTHISVCILKSSHLPSKETKKTQTQQEKTF